MGEVNGQPPSDNQTDALHASSAVNRKIVTPQIRPMRIAVLAILHLLWLSLSAWIAQDGSLANVYFITQIGASLAVIALVAALGPGTILRRGVAVVLATLVLSSVLNIWNGSPLNVHGLQYLSNAVSIFAMLSLATLFIFTLGSNRKWRFGPECLPPVRMTIPTIMLATLMISGVNQGLFVVQQRAYDVKQDRELQNNSATRHSQSDDEIRFSAALKMLLSSSLLFVLGITSALAIRHVAARYAMGFVPLAFTALIIAIERPFSGQQLSSDEFWSFGVFILSSILAGMVVAISIAQLGKAGWVFSRRLDPRLSAAEPSATN